jgi:WASH complex subunit strumpellin
VVLFLTNPARTVYAPECSAWFSHLAPDQRASTSTSTSTNSSSTSSKNKTTAKTVGHSDTIETCGVRTFALLEKALGVVGLRGLDRLLAFRTVYEFNLFVKFYETEVSKHRTVLEQVNYFISYFYFCITLLVV